MAVGWWECKLMIWSLWISFGSCQFSNRPKVSDFLHCFFLLPKRGIPHNALALSLYQNWFCLVERDNTQTHKETHTQRDTEREDRLRVKPYPGKKLHQTRGCVMSHYGPCHLHFKKHLKGKRKNHGNSNISPCKKKLLIFQNKKILYKKPKSFKKYYNSITTLNFQHKPKISFFKNPHVKIDLLLLLLLPRGQNSLNYYTL